MAKYNSEKVAQCEEWIRQHGLMEYGGAMLREFCKAMDIDNKTYYRWLQEYDEFKEAVNRAKEAFKSQLTQDLAISLAEAAKGYEREETETELAPGHDGGEPVVRRIKRKTVYYQPNVAAAIFLLTNLDPEHFQNRQRGDIVIKKPEEKEMTLEEINAEIARLSKLDKDTEEKPEKE